MELKKIKAKKKKGIKIFICGIVFAIIADITRIVTHTIWTQQREYAMEHYHGVDPADVGLFTIVIGYGMYFLILAIAAILVLIGIIKFLVFYIKQVNLEEKEENKESKEEE